MIVGRPGIAFRARRTEGQLREQPEVTVYSRSREDAEEVIEAFESEFAPKDQRAVDCLVDDSDKLLTPRDSPAELRTTNVIESPFPTVRLRQRVTKGRAVGPTTKGIVVAFKLLDVAQGAMVQGQ
jgi:hypothetical protein